MENLTQKLIGKEFKNFAEVYNFILKPKNPFSSKLGHPNYVGLKRGDNSFISDDGIENILIKSGNLDPNYRNEFFDDKNIWLESCITPDLTKRKEWTLSRFSDKKKLRVFVIEEGSGVYKFKGVYKQMDMKYKYIIDKDYEKIRDRICDMKYICWDLIRVIQNGSQYERIEKIIKKDKIMTDAIDKINEIFKELTFICETIQYNELLDNLIKINVKYDKNNPIREPQENEDSGDCEYVEAGQIMDIIDKEIEEEKKDPDYIRKEKYGYFTSFLMPCKVAIKNYELFKNELNKEILEDKWKYMLVIRFIDYNLGYYPKRKEKIDYFEYVFPELFKNCPVDDFLICFNVNFELTIRYDIEKLKDEVNFFDYYGITKF